MTAEDVLKQILAIVQDHMPPGGPTDKQTLSKIIACVDPWPLIDPALLPDPPSVIAAKRMGYAPFEYEERS